MTPLVSYSERPRPGRASTTTWASRCSSSCSAARRLRLVAAGSAGCWSSGSCSCSRSPSAPTWSSTTHASLSACRGARLWSLPIARSAEPSRFIVFGLLVLALALALWLAAPARSRLLLAARWGLGLLALAAIFADVPTSYQAVIPLPPGYQPPAHACGRPTRSRRSSPTGLYRQYLHPGEIVVIVTHRGNAGMLFQADRGLLLPDRGRLHQRVADAADALPHPVTALAHPTRPRTGCSRTTSARPGWAPSSSSRPGKSRGCATSPTKLGMHGTSAGGVTVYPVGPWLASQARLPLVSHQLGLGSSGSLAPRRRARRRVGLIGRSVRDRRETGW